MTVEAANAADLIYRAAGLLREHVEAMPHRDEAWQSYEGNGPYLHHVAHTGDPQMAGVADVIWPEAGDYIALLHPPVALALADRLEYEARNAELDLGFIGGRERAIAVARAILREAAPA